MGGQATIGTDGGESEDDESDDTYDQVLDELPPERLLSTNDMSRIRGGVRCMRSVETVREYVAYENGHEQRQRILKLLQERATELRENG
jgi:hypothetical protein